MTTLHAIRIERTQRSTYPDLSVVRGELERAKDDDDAITSPTVLVEVLSDTTESSDRGDEWAHYQRLDSLEEHVPVWQREPPVEVFRRAEHGWTHEAFGAGTQAPLRSIDVVVDADEL